MKLSWIIIVDLDLIDELLIRYSAFFHRTLTALECSSKSSIYTLQDCLGERKTLALLIILSFSSLYSTKTILFVADFKTWNQDVTEIVPKADRQGI